MAVAPQTFLADPFAARVLRALLACGDDCPTDDVRSRLEADGGEGAFGAATVALRRLAEAGMVSYRLAAPASPGSRFPKTLHSLTTKGRERARGSAA